MVKQRRFPDTIVAVAWRSSTTPFLWYLKTMSSYHEIMFNKFGADMGSNPTDCHFSDFSYSKILFMSICVYKNGLDFLIGLTQTTWK